MKKLFFIMSFILLTACSPARLPNINSYTLNTTPNVLQRTRATQQSLLVSIPQAAPGFDTQNMVYTERAYQLKYFAKNQWIAPPAQLLLPLLTQTLQNTNYYRAVVAAPFAGITDLRLDTKLLELTQNIQGSHSELQMSMHAQLINSRTNRVIATRTFSTTRQISAMNPYQVVLVANLASADLLREIAQFCLKYS